MSDVTNSIPSKVCDLLPPPFAWIEIPAGKVTLVNTWDDNGQVYLKKNQPLEFHLPTFTIGKYPVTNAQFARFVEANGYHEPKWWTAAGWQTRQEEKWTEPRYWQDTNWNGADYPIVGVSWYEALAFCDWLSAASGEKILLPTEQQWQCAAQGGDSRVYPWGNQWDGSRCNNSVKPEDSSRTTPVTQYEGLGDSPFGISDLAGNVWEWCLNEYYSGTKNSTGAISQVLRGGSWNDYHADDLRADCRNWARAFFRTQDFGFRLALSIISAQFIPLQ